MSRVFLSYASEDADVARGVAARLGSSSSIEPFGRLLSEHHHPSDSMRDSLRESDSVVVFLSESAFDSPWVQFEYGAAISMGKRVIPVILGKEGAELHVPKTLESFAYLDARGLGADELASRLNEVIAGKQGVSAVKLDILGADLKIRDVVRILADADCNILSANSHLQGDRVQITYAIEGDRKSLPLTVVKQLEDLPGVEQVKQTEVVLGQ